MTIEIVYLPIDSMVIFRSYVNVYQRVKGVVKYQRCEIRYDILLINDDY